MKNLLYVLLWGYMSCYKSFGQMIYVRLEQIGDIQQFTFISKAKTHITIGDSYPDKIYEIKQNESVWIAFKDGEVLLKKGDQFLGLYPKVRFITDGEEPYFSILTNGKTYTYADNLIVKTNRSNLILTNEVFIENYIAGVMAGEVGSKISPEFLKVQAVCSRTYVYKGLGKHRSEGFDMCDKVHCQAYKGVTVHQKKYQIACHETKNEVITTKDGKLIDAVFYANCGGATANSEDVWPNEVAYLRSVNDGDFCSRSINTHWRKMINKTDFLNSIGKYYNITASSYQLERDASGRVKYLLVNGKNEYKITGEQLRRMFGLKSARFSISAQGNYLYFIGKGFGHGVGMCQDGAYTRSEVGWKYDKIIQFYYKDVEIKPIEIQEFQKWKY
ncbi:MAG: hypothetical protein KatS3mg035_0460 [Bacteroidia bacterium]|nr:MAG: hypothetical protein KatS3mg035_0460 [Bacteroidia bacterium]